MLRMVDIGPANLKKKNSFSNYSPESILNQYPPQTKVREGYIDFTLSVRPSVCPSPVCGHDFVHAYSMR